MKTFRLTFLASVLFFSVLVAYATNFGDISGSTDVSTLWLSPSTIDDTAYDATTWNGDTTHAPSKNAVRDKIESLAGVIPTISDTAFASSWNGVTTVAPSKNAVYDWGHTFDTDDDGKVNVLDLAAGIPKTDSSGVLSLATLGTDYLDATYISDTAFASSWNGVTTIAPSKNAVYDWGHTFDTDDDGKVNVLDMGAGIVKTDAGGVVSIATADTDYTANSFKTFSVSGQSDVVADAAADALTLAAGTNITITTNAGTDTITVAASGGAASPYVGADGANTDVAVNNTAYQTVLSKSVTLAANSTLIIDIWGSLLNNSGGAITYSFQVNVGAVAVFDYVALSSVSASSTSRYPQRLQYVVSVSASNVWRSLAAVAESASIGAANAVISTGFSELWNNGTNDLTGAQTVTFKIKSNGNTATQTFTLHSYAIQVIPQT